MILHIKTIVFGPLPTLGILPNNFILEHMVEDEVEMMENLSNLTCVLGLMEWIKDGNAYICLQIRIYKLLLLV